MAPAGSKNTPENKAREKIDVLLEQSGWTVQDRDAMNLTVPAVAVREFKLEMRRQRHNDVDGPVPRVAYEELVARDKCSLG